MFCILQHLICDWTVYQSTPFTVSSLQRVKAYRNTVGGIIETALSVDLRGWQNKIANFILPSSEMNA